MKTNKLLGLLPVSLLSVFALSGCDNNEETRVLRILNFEDYIYEYEEGDEEYSSPEHPPGAEHPLHQNRG